ncbi:MAG: hypothetical protein RI900_711 [Actinomycetota bacterium]
MMLPKRAARCAHSEVERPHRAVPMGDEMFLHRRTRLTRSANDATAAGMRVRTGSLASAAATGILLAACAAPVRLAPPPFDAPVATRPEVPNTTVPVTASVPHATSSPLVEGGPRLSPDGPWRLVDSAPGLDSAGLVYELLPRLWAYLPLREDIEHGIVWTLTEADVPVVEAYLQARRVFYLATETSPHLLADTGWSRWYDDGGAGFAEYLATRDAAGEVFVREQGVVLRPVVLGELRDDSHGVVFDCILDGGVWRRPDGSLGADSVEGVVPNGVSTLMTLRDGEWRMGHLAAQPEACE